MVVTSLVKYTLPLPHPKTSRIYLIQLHPVARDFIYGLPLKFCDVLQEIF